MTTPRLRPFDRPSTGRLQRPHVTRRAPLVFVVIAALAVGCGDDAPSPVDAGRPVDASLPMTDQGGIDGSAAADLGGPLPDGGSSGDGGGMGEPDSGVDDAIRFQVLQSIHTPEFVYGVRVRSPFTVAGAGAEVELRVLLDFPGEVWVEDDFEEVLLYDAFEYNTVIVDTLAPGAYGLVVDWPGATDPTLTEQVVAQVAIGPSLDPAYATRVGAVAEIVRSIGSQNAADVPLTVRAGHRYIVHGASGSIESYVLDAADVPRLYAGESVTPLRRWAGIANGPAPEYLDLPPGDYGLVSYNPDTVARSVALSIHEWRLQ